MNEEQLREKIVKALCCDPKCGHEMEPETCFEHQVDRIKDILCSYQEELVKKVEGMKLDYIPESAGNPYWGNGYNKAIEDFITLIQEK